VMYVMVSFCVVFAAKVMVIVVDLAIKWTVELWQNC
jgi:hypothetical protein